MYISNLRYVSWYIASSVPFKPLPPKGCPPLRVFKGFKGGTRGTPIMPRDAVSRTANVERNGGHKWVKGRIQNFQYTELAVYRQK